MFNYFYYLVNLNKFEGSSDNDDYLFILQSLKHVDELINCYTIYQEAYQLYLSIDLAT